MGYARSNVKNDGTKIGHPKSGANCAWVPSPTAATLHSLHYHKINVFDEQKKIQSREKAKVGNILEIPLIDPTGLLRILLVN